MKRFGLKYLFFIGLFLVLGACLPSEQKTEKRKDIQKISISGTMLCIPQNYIKGRDDPTNSTVPIQTMYPDFLPLEKRPNEYWKEGEWWRQVSILLSHIRTTLTYEELAQKKIDVLKAYKVVGLEYDGLLHRTQPEGEVQDIQDLWVELDNNKVAIAYIACSEKLTDISNPQCVYAGQ